MARWDDLHRAIEAKDNDAAERVWLELVETDLDAIDRFLTAASQLSEKPGGKRQAGILLWMLAEALKDKGRGRNLIPVYAALAATGPDDGTLRTQIAEAAREAYADRADLDALLEKSGVVGGETAELGSQAAALASYLRLEPGTYVYHKGGWGAGRVVDYRADRGRCVIDFQDKPGHEMDIDAAAQRLELLPPDDIRALALSDPKGLRKWATEEPLEMLRQVLGRFNGSASLRHVKDALVPDAVPTSRWSTWWKEARKAAHIDPRFHVSGGRDPRIEYHGSARIDFRTQVERTFTGCATVEERQKAARVFVTTAGEDQEARATLSEILSAQRDQARGPSARLGWELVLADLEGAGTEEVLRRTIVEQPDETAFVTGILDDETRGAAGRVWAGLSETGPEQLLAAILKTDDPILANAGVDRFASAGRPELVPLLLDTVDTKPALTPNLWAWYVRGLRRNRWDGRAYEPYALVQRLLKVIDAVEYRGRRTSSARDKRGVSALLDVLAAKNGELMRMAAESTDRAGARHLLQVLEQNRGVKGRQLQKLQALVLRAQPDALRSEAVVVAAGEPALGERLDRIYMTAAGLERLKAQRDHIANEEIPENAKEIARAREFGDLSENAEYHAARERAGLLQAKVDMLNSDLARAVVLTPDVVRADAVSVGARVKLEDADGQELVYTLLGPPDSDVKHGVINYLTPLGQALLNKKPGDHVQVTVGDESRDFKVLAIENAMA